MFNSIKWFMKVYRLILLAFGKLFGCCGLVVCFFMFLTLTREVATKEGSAIVWYEAIVLYLILLMMAYLFYKLITVKNVIKRGGGA